MKLFLIVRLINYVPKDHWLCDLEQQLALVFPELLTVFPRPTLEDQERFENFDNAYIGARYEKDYFISDEDLVYFGQRVEVLLDLAEKKWQEHLPKLEMLSLRKK